MYKTNNYRVELCCGIAYLIMMLFSSYPGYVNFLPIVILGFFRLIMVIFVLLLDAKIFFTKKINNIFEEIEQDDWTNYE